MNMAGVLKSVGTSTFFGQSGAARLLRKSNLKVLQCDLFQPYQLVFHKEFYPVPAAIPIASVPSKQFNQCRVLKTSLNYYSSEKPQTKPNQASQQQDDKPDPGQMQEVYDRLQKSLEKTFTHAMDYSLYHNDIVFIDNIRHIKTQGLTKYIQQVALLKTVGHIKFAYVKFDIINMSMSQEEGRITVRWRIKGLSGLRVMLKFWKYKLWKWQELMKQHEIWYDGISYFDVGGDGKIFQHIADKVMEDKDRETTEKARNNVPLAAKLGSLAAVRVKKL